MSDNATDNTATTKATEPDYDKVRQDLIDRQPKPNPTTGDAPTK